MQFVIIFFNHLTTEIHVVVGPVVFVSVMVKNQGRNRYNGSTNVSKYNMNKFYRYIINDCIRYSYGQFMDKNIKVFALHTCVFIFKYVYHIFIN